MIKGKSIHVLFAFVLAMMMMIVALKLKKNFVCECLKSISPIHTKFYLLYLFSDPSAKQMKDESNIQQWYSIILNILVFIQCSHQEGALLQLIWSDDSPTILIAENKN